MRFDGGDDGGCCRGGGGGEGGRGRMGLGVGATSGWGRRGLLLRVLFITALAVFLSMLCS